MKCQICYFSPQGHSKELAFTFKTLFPSRTAVMDLCKEKPFDADMTLIGFELLNDDVDEIPEIIRNILTTLSSGEVIVFATCPLAINEKTHWCFEMTIKSMLPPECRFHGLFVCRGEVYCTMTDDLETQKKQDSENTAASYVLNQYRMSKGHPNSVDVRNGRRFISRALNLNK